MTCQVNQHTVGGCWSCGQCSTLQIKLPVPTSQCSGQLADVWRQLSHQGVLLLQSVELPQGGKPWKNNVKSTCQRVMLAVEAAVSSSGAPAA